MAVPKVWCTTCIHLYTTWDQHFPYGCRAMSIKSSRLPAEIVKQSSGMDCLAYVEKVRKQEK